MLTPSRSRDQRGRRDYFAARRLYRLDRLAAGQAGGDDVFYHQHLFTRRQRKAAAQFERAGGAFDEHRLNPQRAAHFMADDDPAHRGRDDLLDLLAHFARNLLCGGQRQSRGAHRVHQHARALQVIGAVAARGEQEMPFEKGLAGPEFGEDFVVLHDRHNARVGGGSSPNGCCRPRGQAFLPCYPPPRHPRDATRRSDLSQRRGGEGQKYAPARLRDGTSGRIGRSDWTKITGIARAF